MMKDADQQNISFAIVAPAVLPDGQGGWQPCPELLTEDELIRLLRVPEVSKAGNFHNVITHLKKSHNLPCIHICRQPLYPAAAVTEWIKKRTEKEGIK